MILTLTPNTALDRVIFVDHFAFGETVRATGVVDGMGGKGAVISWVLGQLGTPSLATGFVAGETGRRMEAMLRAVGAQTDFLRVAGETRTNYVVARNADRRPRRDHRRRACAPTAETPRASSSMCSPLWQGRFPALRGSLPAGMPVDWYVPLLREARARAYRPCSTRAIRFWGRPACAAGDACPTSSSPTRPRRPRSWGARCGSGRRPCRRRANCERGVSAPWSSPSESRARWRRRRRGLWVIPPLAVRVLNTAGAGDGFNAGLMQARLRGEPWRGGAALGGGGGHGRGADAGTGECRPEDVRALLLFPGARGTAPTEQG